MAIGAGRGTQAISQIVYIGEAVVSGSMDVRELGPALVGLGEMCEQANRLLTGGQTTLRVNVRALEPGSFQISYEAIQELVANVQLVLDSPPVRQARDVLVTLGLVHAPGTLADYGMTAIRYLKWLAGRKPVASVSQESGAVNVHVEGDNNNITIKQDVYLVASDSKVVASLAAVLRPLQARGIDRLEIREGASVVETVTRDEAPPLIARTPEPEVLAEDERVALVEIVKPSFKEDLKWRFTEGSGSFGADIEDPRFLQRVSHGEKFSKGHMLRVRLRVRKSRNPDGRLVASNRVVEVLEDFPINEEPGLTLPPGQPPTGRPR